MQKNNTCKEKIWDFFSYIDTFITKYEYFPQSTVLLTPKPSTSA